jgi:glycosyltransferase involved in cell wall biosynthesis
VDPLEFPSFKEVSPELPAEFLLFVGSLEPGKNLRLLKEMYLLAENSGKALPPLVLIGARWKGVESEGAPRKDWVYLGNQPDRVLALAYRRAKALLFPSIYEGFGLPVVEAQSTGCPVICSPVASLPEVAGNGALLVPLAAGDYLRAVSQLEENRDLRDNMIRQGKSNVSRFSWKRCAEETAAVYRTALG